MGIYREEYLFLMGFPAIETILLTVWKNQKLRIQMSVLESALASDRGAAEEYIYVLAHPKHNILSRMLPVYQPIIFTKQIFEGESRIILAASTPKSGLIAPVSAALLALGGVKILA